MVRVYSEVKIMSQGPGVQEFHDENQLNQYETNVDMNLRSVVG